jgi:hypothetical protein
LGGVQNIEREEECSDIEKREVPDDSKSWTPIERGAVIERTERIAKDLRMAHKKRQNWISVR